MKLHELVDTPVVEICDPCRMLGPHKLSPQLKPHQKEIARESFGVGNTSRHVILVQDDETGLITRQYLYGDGHLEGVGD